MSPGRQITRRSSKRLWAAAAAEGGEIGRTLLAGARVLRSGSQSYPAHQSKSMNACNRLQRLENRTKKY